MAAPASHGHGHGQGRAPAPAAAPARDDRPGEARPPARRQVEAFHLRGIGEDALAFPRWFTRNKFALMEGFLGELERDPVRRDKAMLRERFLHAARHAQQVLLVRLAVTVLLSLGALATATALVLEHLLGSLLGAMGDAPVGGVQGAVALAQMVTSPALLDQLQAVAGSLTLVLVVARLALDRYLELIAVTCTYTAMQLASAR